MPQDCTQYRGRSQRICLRQQGRNDRTEMRQQGRTDRNYNRTQARQVAYQSGIDPYAAWAGSASNMVGSAASAAASILTPNAFGSMFGNGVFAKGEGGKDTPQEKSFFGDLLDMAKNNLMGIAIGGGLLYLIRKTL